MSILDFVIIKSTSNKLYQKRTIRNENNLFQVNNNPNTIVSIKVFTDGACIHNGKKNAKAGIGIYFGKNDSRNVSERIKGKQSNNTAELKAILKVYEILKDKIENKELINIYSDSIYAIRCCGDYGLKMNKKKWKNKNKLIPNHELVKKAFELFYNKNNIKLIHVKAHTERKDELSLGNAEADRLANEAIGVNSLNKKVIKKNYLNVPFSQKDVAKKLGAKWDKNVKNWYFLDNIKENKIELIKMFG